MAPSLFWIGLGNMGRGMVKNIVEKGPFASPVLIYNRTAQRAHDLSAKLATGKTTVVSSIEEGVAQADVIFICLADDAAVEGTASTLAPSIKGKLVVDCSTISPDTTTRVAEAILSAGGEFVACPVFGAPAMAEAGQLIAVPAGPKASVEKIRPYLTGVTSRGEIDMCDQPYSKALLLKVLGNTFILNMVEQLAEGHVAAEKTGLGTQYIHKFLELIFPGPYAAYSTRMLSGDYYKREEPLFAVDLARKDVRHGLDLAKDAGVRLMNLENADAHLVGVKEHMGAKGDIAGIYGAVRKESGLKFENGE